MAKKHKVVFLRSIIPHTASAYYFKGMQKQDVDLIEIPFDPHQPDQDMKFPDADLLLMVDCGLPVDFPSLKCYRSPKGYVSIDSCHKLKIHQEYCEKHEFDYIWVAQKHMVSEFGSNAAWLPLAADKDVHVYKPTLTEDESSWKRIFRRNHYDIGMSAAPYEHRRRFKKLFKKAGLSTNFYFRKKFGKTAAYEIALCTIGFNVGAGFRGSKGQDINMRVFETMANGEAILLTNIYDNLGYEDLFEDGKHYSTFRSEEEAVEKALYYAKNSVEASCIAREGQSHILSNHTYAHRCRKILSIL